MVLDGHSGLVLPVPISNTEVKKAHVLGGTALRGNPRKLSAFLKFLKKLIKHKVFSSDMKKLKAFLIMKIICIIILLSISIPIIEYNTRSKVQIKSISGNHIVGKSTKSFMDIKFDPGYAMTYVKI